MKCIYIKKMKKKMQRKKCGKNGKNIYVSDLLIRRELSVLELLLLLLFSSRIFFLLCCSMLCCCCCCCFLCCQIVHDPVTRHLALMIYHLLCSRFFFHNSICNELRERESTNENYALS